MSTAAQMKTGGLPKGELLGRYRTYDDAQKVVDHLAAAEGFDVKTLTIVGNDLRSVEHIRSRLSYPRVAGAGAAQGAMFGFFIGLLMLLFAPEAPLVNMLLAVLLGVCIWTLIGVVSYAVRRGKRDFSSSSQLVATTYDVVCDFSVAAKARQLVAHSGVISLNAWNDPTGRGANLGGAQPPPAQPAAPASGGPEQSAEAQTSPAGGAQRPGHEDLPDGRPRYGVRLDQKKSGEAGASSETTAVPHDEPQNSAAAKHADAGPAEQQPRGGRAGAEPAEGDAGRAQGGTTGAEPGQGAGEKSGADSSEEPGEGAQPREDVEQVADHAQPREGSEQPGEGAATQEAPGPGKDSNQHTSAPGPGRR